VAVIEARAGEFPVNSFTSGTQDSSAAARLVNGNTIIVWRSAENGGDIKGQLLDASGARVGGEFRINSDVAGDQRLPAVTALANGGFAVAWASGTRIEGQSFAADGSISGVPFGWTIQQPGSYPRTAYSLSIADMPGQGIAVGWSDVETSSYFSPGYDKYWLAQARIVADDGSTIGAITTFGSSPTFSTVDVIGTSDGGYRASYTPLRRFRRRIWADGAWAQSRC
jgi:hypothetical protein